MKLLAMELPSHGYDSKLDSVNISPMTFIEMMEYDQNSTKDEIKQTLVDIDLLRKENPRIDELNYYDLEAVLFMKKISSVTTAPTINLSDIYCPSCGYNNSFSINVANISYTDFDQSLISKIDSIMLGGKRIRIKVPKIRDVVKLSTTLSMYHQVMSFKLFQIITFLDIENQANMVINAVKAATLDEILMLEYLRNLMCGANKEVEYTCSNPKCKRKESVRLSNVLTDMFRLLQLNQEFDKSKIVLSKGMQSGDSQ